MNAPVRDALVRKKRIVMVVGCVLLISGIAVLLLKRHLPVPIGMVVGLTDLFTGCVLLVAARQINAQ